MKFIEKPEPAPLVSGNQPTKAALQSISDAIQQSKEKAARKKTVNSAAKRK